MVGHLPLDRSKCWIFGGFILFFFILIFGELLVFLGFFYDFFYFWSIFIFTFWFPQCRSRLIILSRNYWVAVGFIEVFFF